MLIRHRLTDIPQCGAENFVVDGIGNETGAALVPGGAFRNAVGIGGDTAIAARLNRRHNAINFRRDAGMGKFAWQAEGCGEVAGAGA